MARSMLLPLVAALLLTGAAARYEVAFYHNSKNCSPAAKAITWYGESIRGDFPAGAGKCRYTETLNTTNGQVVFHLAFHVSCTSAGARLVDYKPSIGAVGCAAPTQADPAADPAYAFTLNFTKPAAEPYGGSCIGAASPDGDPRGESWQLLWDSAAC
eukprot:TRINITY_DN18862_c0_g1_i1.p1 TRINITY_DN18862_c0_g1~~TRINITY_DN18862_c0_g1_i1.p1  ORF type:complete len:184 (+),score=63.59 TRINITY_DN18862_c0_g1_i1:82-552(+)